jgi:hypothetical protein
MPDEIPPVKRKRKRRCDPSSLRQRCRVIAEAIGAHEVTVQRWHFEGRLKDRIMVYLIQQRGEK